MSIAARSRVSAPVLLRPLIAEALGTGLLVATVVGSGVMAQNLAPGQVLLQLLCNALATVAVLGLLIALLAPASGSHFNPAVTLVAAVTGALRWPIALGYVLAQLVGGCLGTVLAHAMFGLDLVQWTGATRGGAGQLLGEVVATAGLLLVITLLVRDRRVHLVPLAVPAWIFAAYFFTSSTSFANPAVTVGRALTGTFAGIAPASVPAFVLAQLVGAALGVGLAHVLRSRPVVS
ncbi:MAG TPA: MIP/aquaporin family protein [Actinophytocola sp.]|uniref:MIP/aquaporin family protein n=1 Tax=Actinophytocola sp. TaxID=1872138 RepID=UPI002DB8E75E|nr:MIP/aquaporin family protein [Actinophytocola sp.]HEU5470636.1 MIP/aquaporin family protein [Actinophytocola sp.]